MRWQRERSNRERGVEMPNVSIAISVRDNYSTALRTMRSSMRGFDKDLEGTQRKLEALNNTKATLKVDADQLRRTLREAEKQYASTRSEADRLNLELANANYENARQNLDLVTREAKQTQKALMELSDTSNRIENRASTGWTKQRDVPESGGIQDVFTGFGQRLGSSGLFSALGQLAGEAAGTYIGSRFGAQGSALFGGALSGAGQGAAIGTMIAPGVGTVIGTVAGAGMGLLQGGNQVFEQRDDAFRSVVQAQYEKSMQQLEESLTSGMSIAGSRETSLQAFTTLFGSAEQAEAFTKSIKDFANVTPFLYEDLEAMAKTLKTYGYSVEELMPTMQAIGDAGAALGMKQEDMNMVATALGRMRTSNKTTMEYLDLMLERGIPVYDALAESMGKSKDAVMEMVSDGLIPGEESAKAIADYLGEAYAGSMDAQSKTLEGLQSTYQGLMDELDAAMGEGAARAEKRGLQEDINYYGGESGEAIKKINEEMGEWEQSLANAQRRLLREYQDEALKTIEEQGLTGPDAYLKLQEARIEAEAAWAQTDGAKKQAEIQSKLIEDAGKIMAKNNAFEKFGYEIGLELSKGIKAAVANSDEDYVAFIKAQSGWGINEGFSTGTPDEAASAGIGAVSSILGIKGYAYGLERVPYDNFPALLHEGEQVLTASQARSQPAGSVTVAKLADEIVVREDTDIDRIATALVRKLEQIRRVV